MSPSLTRDRWARRGSTWTAREWSPAAARGTCLAPGCSPSTWPSAAPAQAPSPADDAAYCTKLGDYATRYLGDPGGQGGTRPDFDIMEGVADCRKGRTAEGIAILEKKIRSKGFTPPARG